MAETMSVFFLLTSAVLGQTPALPRTYSLVSPNPEGFVFGVASGSDFGSALVDLGDWTGDQLSDFAVGAPGEDAQTGLDASGRVYVYQGISGNLLETLVSPMPTRNGRFGTLLLRFPDTNSNGLTEFLVAELPNRVYSFDIRTANLVRTVELTSEIDLDGLLLGSGLALWIDEDRDSVPELVTGTSADTKGDVVDNGMLVVHSGRTGVAIRSLRLDGLGLGGFTGWFQVMPNIAGSGLPEVIIAQSENDAPPVFSLLDFGAANAVYTFNAESLGIPSPFDYAPRVVTDTNRDAVPDLLLILFVAENPEEGIDPLCRMAMVSGRSGAVRWQLPCPFCLDCSDNLFGGPAQLGAVGDANRDGAGDFVIGALFNVPDTAGEFVIESALVDGARGTVIRNLVPPAESGTFQFAIGLEDANGDGFRDIILGDPLAKVDTLSCAGRVHAYMSDGAGRPGSACFGSGATTRSALPVGDLLLLVSALASVPLIRALRADGPNR